MTVSTTRMLSFKATLLLPGLLCLIFIRSRGEARVGPKVKAEFIPKPSSYGIQVIALLIYRHQSNLAESE